ncbi:MAG: mechanosensitive ion channel family protein, partial [bacterium]
MLSCDLKPWLSAPATLIISLICLLPLSTAIAQEADGEQNIRALTDEDINQIETQLGDVKIKLRMADKLATNTAGKDGLELQILQSRVSKLLSESLEITIKLAQSLASRSNEGRDIDAYLPEVKNYLSDLPVRIQNSSMRAGDYAKRNNPTVSALEQAVNDDRIIVAAKSYDDSSWAIMRSVEASRSLGIDTSKQEEYLAQRVEELLANAMVYLDISLRDVSNMRAASRALPQDAEVTAKLRIAENRVASIVAIMENNLLILSRLELPTTYYRQQLLSATGKVSADVLDAEIVTSLVAGWVSDLKDLVRDKGPNFFFQLLLFFLILFLFIKLAGWVKHLIDKAIDTAGVQMSKLARRMVTNISGNVVIVVGFLVALSQVGISLGPVLAGLGIVGFIIGFALQDSLGNFASGVLILIYRPYDVGDVVKLGGVTGQVHKMSLVNTTILTLDNQTLIIPNNKIWQDVIVNLTYQTKRRVDLVFGITYDQDIDQVEAVIHKVLQEEPRVLDDPEPNVRVHELADSSVNLIVRPWVKTDDYWDVYWDLTKKIKQSFDAAGITIPFPQRDVHVVHDVAGEL